MKCEACKYDDAIPHDIFEYGDWGKLKGWFLLEKEGLFENLEIDVIIYVCPKCGTLKIKGY